MWRDFLLLTVSGAVGTISRFIVAKSVIRACGNEFPWGTIVVNLIGCFLFGLIWSLTEHRVVLYGHARLILLTGFMGAFTTFSTFAFETCALLQKLEYGPALANGLGQVVLGVALMFAGQMIGRQF